MSSVRLVPFWGFGFGFWGRSVSVSGVVRLRALPAGESFDVPPAVSFRLVQVAGCIPKYNCIFLRRTVGADSRHTALRHWVPGVRVGALSVAAAWPLVFVSFRLSVNQLVIIR